MEKSNLILPKTLSDLNGSIVDVKTKVGNIIEPTILKKTDELIDKNFKYLPEVVIYEHIDFGGANERTNLNYHFVGGFWNDKISSIVVVSGIWEFYEHHHYEGRKWKLGPGYYRWIVDNGIPNDIISSFKCVALT